MLPINKKYGLWCEMYDNNGKLLKTIETLKVGAADYSGPSNSGNAASRAVIYGYADPRYQFDVRVTTYEDSLDKCQGDYKTAFWDMNTTDNKLYFTKFSTIFKTDTQSRTILIEATDLADYLVKKGMPFRTAYKLSGGLVAKCIREGRVLEELTLDEYRAESELFDEDVFEAIDLAVCVEKRISEGGTSVASVEKQIESVRAALALS